MHAVTRNILLALARNTPGAEHLASECEGTIADAGIQLHRGLGSIQYAREAPPHLDSYALKVAAAEHTLVRGLHSDPHTEFAVDCILAGDAARTQMENIQSRPTQMGLLRYGKWWLWGTGDSEDPQRIPVLVQDRSGNLRGPLSFRTMAGDWVPVSEWDHWHGPVSGTQP